MRTLFVLLGVLTGCKMIWRSDNEALSVQKAAASCRDECGNRIEMPELLGCVSTCDTWSTQKIKVLSGGARDKSQNPDPFCELTYELRDSSLVLPATGRQAFSFGFRQTKGPQDSGYLSFSTGLDPQSRLLDFTKPESRRTLQRSFTNSSLIAIFQRNDPSQAGLPTFSATEASVNETKSLIVVLEEKFDPRGPFGRIKFVRYQESRKGALIHDLECMN